MDNTWLATWRHAVGRDLELFALLHDREPTAELLTQLSTANFPYSLGLHLQSARGQDCCQLMQTALTALPNPLTQEVLDELAADFAAIYLNHQYQASPCESVWLDEDGLMRQEPMFKVRKWYENYQLQVDNWRVRSEDHLVYQLQFLSHLLLLDDKTAHLNEVRSFMDEHLLVWFKDFAARVAQRSATAYFGGLALLTQAYLEEFRGLLDDVLSVNALVV
ncbi:TorD/DmsD family molecular chaperone [Thioflexithrix psekupsensis]|uniref:Dehydrogenase n=1 Tax=Thioflexithrix psekupsensis TaxID=1570016 RepID=A0A251X663_9GAMM|nr:molecular chaperone TorD family protein [Thioflexithrix psekupsensis]OUD13112.1 hypothetical protein TPSD3_10710 [Thioflexithrix psekupsensis]